ncbi:hypothetical protein PANT_18d00024 [Moesziomyces antarcticus T-34]|uniref:MAPKK kinase Kpp4 n=1 Tax=Pseudozyma antarctica (strain T-34) TaxID=1151754 RepID=M9MH18_PSEA3|nr:hypothetical protein PANT_18d00024 [Moesziomyces antarcticus T-34]
MSAATPTSPGFPLQMGSGAMAAQFGAPSSSAGSPRSRPTTPLSAAAFLPAGPTYDDLSRWEDADVAAWLTAARLGHHAATFAENDIRGSVLLDVDQAALKEMGITMIKDRVRIQAAIKLLNKRCADAALARRPSAVSLPPLSPLATHALYANEGEIEYLEHDHLADNSAHAMSPGFGPNSMGLRRGQMRPPPLTLKQSASRGMPGHPSPANNLNNGHGFGLSAARGLTPGAARGSVWNTASSSSTSSKPSTADGALHRKVNSIGGGAAPAIVGASSSSLSSARHLHGHGLHSTRPSTATGASGYSNPGGGSLQSRGGLTSNSPTAATFGGAAASINAGRPSTATGAQTYSGAGINATNSVVRDGYSPLTPISESNSHGNTPTTPSGIQQQQSAGYSVGRGPFASSQRYGASPVQSSSSSSSAHAIRRVDSGEGYNLMASQFAGYPPPNPPTLEDLKRRTIKFISEEDNTTRIVNVSDCRDAYDVMARVLKKFGKPPSANSYTPTADQGPTGDELGATETWGIFATSADGQNTKALSDNELLAICHAPQPHDPLRERGLTLRRIPNHLPGEDARRVPVRSGRNKLEAFFGERMPVAQMQPAGPGSAAQTDEGGAGSVTISGKKMKRASTVSIMSGLGVGPFSNSSSSASASTHTATNAKIDTKQPSKKDTKHATSPTVSSKPSKIRNFFGQRPPSELINTNLADFFPSTDSRALQRTARRSIYGRASASTRSKRNSTWSFVADPDAPPLPNKESLDGHQSSNTPLDRSSASIRERTYDRGTNPIIQIGYDSRSEDGHSHDAHQRGSAQHQYGVAGPPTLPPVVGRDSLDEWSRDLKAVGSPVAGYTPGFAGANSISELRRSIDEHADYSDGGSSSVYTDSDVDSDRDSDTDDGDEPDVYLPSANKPPIKWHKGALIGAGSFGNVFLGMNAKTGLLMAVKQVELPSGDSHLDQRKKGMLDALESEIKLLKTLEHENIVQYLDSFADGSHLNIFLEYVPGGSIVALLRNYGAFEEPLVRNFVRQILKGLSFLHDRGIMHRDIKGANILVDNKGGIKISDFGISKKVESELVLATNKAAGAGGGGGAPRPSLQGSVFWMAPEVVKQTSYTIKADIWSLGCLVVEMISGTHPWAELNQMQALFQIGMGRKPSLPDEISNECRDFLEKTFELDYNARPSAEELLEHAFMGTQMTFPATAAGAGGGDAAGGGEAGADGGEGAVGGDGAVGEEGETSISTSTREKEKRPTRSKSTRRLEREKRQKEAAAAVPAVAAVDSGTPNTPTAATAGVAANAAGADAEAGSAQGGMPESVSTSSIATARGVPASLTTDAHAGKDDA